VVLGRTTAVQQDHDRGVVVAGLDQGMQGKHHAETSGLVNAKYEPEHPVGCRGSAARLASRAGKYGTWRSQVAHLLGVQGVVGSNPAVPITTTPRRSSDRRGVVRWDSADATAARRERTGHRL